MQADGTLGEIAIEKAVLSEMLDVLCGLTKPKDADSRVREALSEAILMLVWAIRTIHFVFNGSLHGH